MTELVLHIDDHLMERLRRKAAAQQRPVEAMLMEAIEGIEDGTEQPHNWALEMARMAEVDTDIEWNESAATLAANSRELLEGAFADDLLARYPYLHV
jgi:hypothetical protein